MASSPLVQLLVQGGLDPRLYGQLQNADLGGEMIRQGIDSSPTSGWGALGRLAQTLAGTYLNNQAISGVGDAVSAGRKSAADDLMKVLGNKPSPPTSPLTVPVPEKPERSSGTLNPSIQKSVDAAAAKYGLDPAYLTKTAMIESSGNPNNVNPTSGAAGLFQFMPRTAREYGLANPKDAEANIDAAARFTVANRDALTKALGRPPTPGELYLAHQQGAGGAIKLLTNPDAPATSQVGLAAVMNNGGAKSMTGRQFANMWTSRYPNAAPDAVQAIDQAAGASPPMVSALQAPGGQPAPAQPTAPAPTQAAQAGGGPSAEMGAAMSVLHNPMATAEDKEIAKAYILRQSKDVNAQHVELTDSQGNKFPAVFHPDTATYTRAEIPGFNPQATPETVTGPSGEQLKVPKENPKEFIKEVTAANAKAATGQFTEAQGKALQFANRMAQAEENLSGGRDLEGTNVWRNMQELVPGVGHYFQPENYRKYLQAKKEFLTAVLRRESGATIKPEEWVDYGSQFFPRPGDEQYPELIKQYSEARRVALESMRKEAGPAYKDVTGISAPAKAETPVAKPQEVVPKTAPKQAPAPTEKPPMEGAQKAPDGQWYVKDPKRPGKYLRVNMPAEEHT